MVVQDKEAIGEGHGYGGFSPMEFRRTHLLCIITRTQICRQITIKLYFYEMRRIGTLSPSYFLSNWSSFAAQKI